MLPGIVVNHKLGIKAYLNGKIKKVFKTLQFLIQSNCVQESLRNKNNGCCLEVAQALKIWVVSFDYT